LRACPVLEQRQWDVRPAGAHVEHRVGHGPPGEEAVERVPGGGRPAQPAVEPGEVAQVAPQDRLVVERAVEQLVGPRETSHQPRNRVGERTVLITGDDLLGVFERFVAVNYITRQAGGR